MDVYLYTKQNIKSIKELEKYGRLINREIYVRLHLMDTADFFIKRYRKFIEMAEKYVEKPAYAGFPIWCSISKKNCLKPDENSVVYCLKVPKDQVIYFSSEKWDKVLNSLYIGKDDNDEKAFNQELKNLGFKNRFSFIDGKYSGLYPEIEEKIISSWTRIFQIESWDEFSVQANLWEIKKEWIEHIIYKDQDIFQIAKDMEDKIEDHRI